MDDFSSIYEHTIILHLFSNMITFGQQLGPASLSRFMQCTIVNDIGALNATRLLLPKISGYPLVTVVCPHLSDMVHGVRLVCTLFKVAAQPTSLSDMCLLPNLEVFEANMKLAHVTLFE